MLRLLSQISPGLISYITDTGDLHTMDTWGT